MDAYRVVVETTKKEWKELVKADDQIVYCEHAQSLIQEVAGHIQQKAHNQIAAVVSRCLESVFEDPYEFKLLFERKRHSTQVRLVFVREGEEITPITGSGGGVLDVAAFALRLACLLLSRPALRRVMILDEPFRHLKPADEYGHKIVAMLHRLVRDFDVQFIMIQNLKEFQTGAIVEISK